MRTDWDNVADWYDQLVGEGGSDYHRNIILPGTLRLLAVQQNQPILDVACGQGVLCRALQQKGAHVTGVDAAAELIRAARKHGPESINYLVGDARKLEFLPGNRFAAVACVLAIQNLHPIQPVFDGVRRALCPGGKFVMVMMHPAFRGSKETSWGWDEAAGVQYRRVDRYLLPRKSPIVTHPGRKDDAYTWSFHKPLESYVRALAKAGLLIDALEEWPSHRSSNSGPRAAAENTARKEIPLFLALRAVRIDAVKAPS